MSSQDLKQLLCSQETQGDEESLKLVRSASHLEDHAKGTSDIKEEPQNESELDKFGKLMEDIKIDPRASFDQITTMHVAARQIKANAEKADATQALYSQALIKDVDKHTSKLNRITTVLQKLLVDAPNDEQLPKLVQALQELKIDHQKITDWALRFNLFEPAKKKARKSP